MFWIYEIKNNRNGKNYIGLSSNIKQRQIRHFTDLRTNRHHNSFLQREFIKYGREAFDFAILEEIEKCTPAQASEKEIYWVAKKDSYHNGYNQNPGGTGGHTGPTNGGSRLTKTDIYAINSVLEFMSRPGALLAIIFETTVATISRVKKGQAHFQYSEEYKALSESLRKNIYKEFVEANNLLEEKAKKTIIESKRKFTEFQVHCVLYNEEQGRIVPLKRLARHLEVSGYTLSCIIQKKTYQDYSHSYKKLNNKQKDEMASFLREKEKQTSRIAGTPLRSTNHNISEKKI